jgi:CRISPR-associated endonuclease/helicase Cas3
LFVGARRVREREAAKKWLERHGFLAGSDLKLQRPAILIATSAGEVGVDLDADHMVCDVVEWERMVQRLGRVNRRGERDDTVVRVIGGAAAEKDDQRAERLANTKALLAQLPALEGSPNASPAALLDLRESAGSEAIGAASTAEPLRPALNRAPRRADRKSVV